MKEMVTLNRKEQRRLMVLNEVELGKTVGREAAELLDLSLRHLRRILAGEPQQDRKNLEEGKVKGAQKQPKRDRLWLNNGSCIRLRPEHKDHVCSYDFRMTRTAESRAFRILTILDEYTRECLTILPKRHITSRELIDVLFELFIFRGIPEHITSDNNPEFTSKDVRNLLNRLGVKTLFIGSGGLWENGYI